MARGTVEQFRSGAGITQPHLPKRLVARSSSGDVLTIPAIIKTLNHDF